MWLSVVLGFAECFVGARYLSGWHEQKMKPPPPVDLMFTIASDTWVHCTAELSFGLASNTQRAFQDVCAFCVHLRTARTYLLVLFAVTVLPRLPWNSRAQVTPCLSLSSRLDHRFVLPCLAELH